MAAIILNNGQQVKSAQQLQAAIKNNQARRMVSTDRIKRDLADLRGEWQEATGGNMHRVTINLGALFDDLQELIEEN